MSLAIPVLVSALIMTQPVDLTPFFSQSDEFKSAYTHFKEKRMDQAADEFRILLATEKAGPRRRASVALYSRSLGKGSAREEALAELAASSHLGVLAHYELGQIAKRRGNLKSALSHFRLVPKNGIYGVLSRLSMAEILHSQKRHKESLVVLKKSFELNPTRYQWGRLSLVKGSALKALGRKAEAITVLRQLWFDRRKSKLANQAVKMLRKFKSSITAGEQVAAEFFQLRKKGKRRLRKHLRWATRRSRRVGRGAIDLAKGVYYGIASKNKRIAIFRFKRASRARNRQLRGYAFYLWAEILERQNKHQQAVGLYLKVARSIKGHPLAAPALARAATLTNADTAQRAGIYAELDARFPVRRNRLYHEWISAFSAFKDGRLAAACSGFDRIHKQGGQSKHLRRNFWSERGLYWLGRCLWKVNKKERAIDAWRRIVSTYPLSYYSHQAYNRLRDHVPEQAKKLRTKARGESHSVKSIVDLSELKIERTPALLLAVELTRAGLFGLAKQELEARARTQRLSSGARTLLSSLDLRQNHRARLNDLGRWRGSLPGRFSPAETRLWKLAFPLPYWDSVQLFSRKFKISPWFVMALIRHESSYRMDAVSRAGATGLMQLMPSTAVHVAKHLLDIKSPSRRSLKRPELNIKLGTRLLQELMSLFTNNEALTLAAYNAGSGSCRRWLKAHWARKQHDTDVFIEEIPFLETHAYVKAVLGSYGAYRFLYGSPDEDAFLSIPLESRLPDGLGSYFKR